MEPINQLVRYYNNTPENNAYHEIIRYLLKNIRRIGKATIYDVADWCYTSPSTISRVIKAIGFEGFSEFKTKICTSLDEYRYLNRNYIDVHVTENTDIAELYLQSAEEQIRELRQAVSCTDIKTIVDLFDKYDKFFFFTGEDFGLRTLQKDLLVMEKEAYILKDFEAQEKRIASLGKDSVVIAIIPDLKEFSQIKKILKQVKERGAILVIICSSKNSPYLKSADYTVSFKGTRTAFDDLAFTILVNILACDYKHRYLDPQIEEYMT